MSTHTSGSDLSHPAGSSDLSRPAGSSDLSQMRGRDSGCDSGRDPSEPMPQASARGRKRKKPKAPAAKRVKMSARTQRRDILKSKRRDSARKLEAASQKLLRQKGFMKILFVIPSTSVFPFEVDESFMSMHQPFGKWMKESMPTIIFGSHNIVGNDVVGACRCCHRQDCLAFGHDWDWKKDEAKVKDESSPSRIASLSTPSLFLAHQIAVNLGIKKDSQMGLICGMAFQYLFREYSREFASQMSEEKFNILFPLYDDFFKSPPPTPLEEKYEEGINFCSRLERIGILPYPSPGVLEFFTNKTIRDNLFEELMVPHFTTKFKGKEFSEIAKKAIKHFQQQYNLPSTLHKQLVAKFRFGTGMDGVFFIKNTNGKWDGKELGREIQGMGKGKETELRIEPFYEALKKEEIRIFAVRLGSKKFTILYQVTTKVKVKGQHEVTGNPTKPVKMDKQINDLIQKAFEKMASVPSYLFGTMRHMILRFDVFSAPKGTLGAEEVAYYLNEVDVVPLAFTWFRDAQTEKTSIESVTDTIAKALMEMVSNYTKP